jgi:hypothetical protein
VQAMTTLSVEELCSYVTQKRLTSSTSHKKLTVLKPMTVTMTRLELDEGPQTSGDLK